MTDQEIFEGLHYNKINYKEVINTESIKETVKKCFVSNEDQTYQGIKTFSNGIDLTSIRQNNVEKIALSANNVDLKGTRINAIHPTTSNRYIELGLDAVDASYIDFHSKDTSNNDYHTRLIARGGTSTVNSGNLTIETSLLNLCQSNSALSQPRRVTINQSGSSLNMLFYATDTNNAGYHSSIQTSYTSGTSNGAGDMQIHAKSVNFLGYGSANCILKINGTTLNATPDEFNTIAGITAGTGEASKALILDSNKRINNIDSITTNDLVLTGLLKKAAALTITSSSYTLSSTIDYTFIILDTTSNSITFNLGDPSATTALKNREVKLKIKGGNNVIFTPSSPAVIDGSTSITVSGNNTGYILCSNNSNWFIISKYA